MAQALHIYCGMRNSTVLFSAIFMLTGSLAIAKEVPKKVTAPAAKMKTAAPIAAAPTAVRAPAALDSNRAVEIRGQSRTLSMMLVLKNGKENINFIKVRKDYNPEISNTPF